MDSARIDKIANDVIQKRVKQSVENRVIKYGGGSQADVKKVMKRIGEILT